MLSVESLHALQQYDSPTVSNVIELFDVRPRDTGFMNPAIKSLVPELPPIVGYASTVTYRTAGLPEENESQSSLMAHLEALALLPAPRIVVLDDLDTPPVGATFGEVMCAIYRRFECVGLVTSGAARDLPALRKLGCASFAPSVCVSHAYGRIVDVHRPVRVGGLTIRPGDLLHADANGVVTIPLEIAEEVALACPLWIKAERMVLDYVEDVSHDVTIEGVKRALSSLAAEIKAIRGTSAGKTLDLV